MCMQTGLMEIPGNVMKKKGPAAGRSYLVRPFLHHAGLLWGSVVKSASREELITYSGMEEERKGKRDCEWEERVGKGRNRM